MQLLPKPEKNRHSAQPNKFSLESINSPPFATPPAIDMTPESIVLGASMIDPSERVVVLVDGSNLFYAASTLGVEIDYTKLLKHLTQNRQLVRAYFYTAFDRNNEKQQGFLRWMRRNGYRVVAKDLVQLPDGSRKANVEVEIAIDMLSLAEYCDTVILISGDGDLAYAVNAAADKGVRIEVVSLFSMTHDDLINVADRYIDLATIQPAIQKS